jgi:hypothetical protein
MALKMSFGYILNYTDGKRKVDRPNVMTNRNYNKAIADKHNDIHLHIHLNG